MMRRAELNAAFASVVLGALVGSSLATGAEAIPSQADMWRIIQQQNRQIEALTRNQKVTDERLEATGDAVEECEAQELCGDHGPARHAQLKRPRDVAVDGLGNVYIADRLLHNIRRVDADTAVMTTWAGRGSTATTPGGGSSRAQATEIEQAAKNAAQRLIAANRLSIRPLSVELLRMPIPLGPSREAIRSRLPQGTMSET